MGSFRHGCRSLRCRKILLQSGMHECRKSKCFQCGEVQVRSQSLRAETSRLSGTFARSNFINDTFFPNWSYPLLDIELVVHISRIAIFVLISIEKMFDPVELCEITQRYQTAHAKKLVHDQKTREFAGASGFIYRQSVSSINGISDLNAQMLD